MEETLKFLRAYAAIYKTERYVSLIVGIATLIILIGFFGYQIIMHRNATIENWTLIANAFIGLGSSGIISVSIGYIFKFMDRAKEAAERFVNHQNTQQND